MKYYGISDKGKVRIQNQDSIYVPGKNESNLYIVADGMGGAKAGDVASIKAIEYIKEYITNNYVEQGDAKIKDMIRASLIYFAISTDANTSVLSSDTRISPIFSRFIPSPIKLPR